MIPQLFSKCEADLFCQIGLGLGMFAAFVVFWLTVMFLVAIMSGWRKLAEKYGLQDGQEMPEGEKFGWKSAALRGRLPTSYNNCLNFFICSEGLGIAPVKIFAFGHPPLFVPWAEIALSERKSFIGKPLNVAIGETGYTFIVWTKPAQAIRTAKERI